MVYDKEEKLLRRREHYSRPEARRKAREYRERPDIQLRRKKIAREYYLKNRKNILKQGKEYRATPERIKYMKKYEQDNQNKITELHKKYYQKNKKRLDKKNREYCLKNEEQIRKYEKEYFQENKTRLMNKSREYSKKRRKTDESYHLSLLIKTKIYQVLTLYSRTGKMKSTKKYGIDIKAIIEHLKPFPVDRKNYHVDHIIPVSWFDLNDSKEIKWAFEPENHQWLTKEENMWKGNRFIWIKEQH